MRERHHRTAGSQREEPAAWPTILVIVGAGIVSAFQVGKAPTALAAVRADLALDLATASWLLSAFAVVGALAGIVVGTVVDHAGARRMALGGLVVQGVCSALGAIAPDSSLLLASRVGEGLGFLTVTVAAPTLIVAVTDARNRGPAIAVWGTFMPVGIALVMLAAPLLPMIGWRGFWIANAALLVLYAGLLALATRSILVPQATGGDIVRDLRETVTADGPLLLFGLFSVFGAAFFAVFGFLPTILSERLAVGPTTGSLLTAGAVAVNALGNLSCGPLLARGVPRAHLLFIGFCSVALCGLGIFSNALPGIGTYALCVVFSAVSGLIPVAIINGAARHAPRPELVGATIGFFMQGNNVGLLTGPAVAGALASTFGWSSLSFLMVALAAVGLLLIMTLRTHPAEAVAPS